MFRERGRAREICGISAILCGSLLLVPRAARADTAACVKAHADGQREMKAGHLVRAGELFAQCGAIKGCPGPIRTECGDLYATVEQSTPTVLFSVAAADGSDITDVKVYVDDVLASDGLNGRSIAIDPGTHRFRYVLPGGETIERELLVRQGEKNRLLSVASPAKAPAPADSTPAEGATASSHGLPAGFWIASGVGAAALTTGLVFAALGGGNQSDVEACAPGCGAPQRDAYDAMQTQYLVADISFVVAAASAGVATWFFLTRDSSSASSNSNSAQQPSWSVQPTASLRAGGVSFTARGF